MMWREGGTKGVPFDKCQRIGALCCCLPPKAIRFHVIECPDVCRRGIAAHARLPVLQPATNFWTSGWNWSLLTWKLIWQNRPVTGERMKAKPNESTHSQNLPANICPRLAVTTSSTLSSKQNHTALVFPHLSRRSIWSFLCFFGSGACRAWKWCVIQNLRDLSEQMWIFKIYFLKRNFPSIYFADSTETAEININSPHPTQLIHSFTANLLFM